MLALDQHQQAAGAAADVKNAMTGANRRLLKEQRASCIPAQQLYQRVV
jgi:hypothetical protein